MMVALVPRFNAVVTVGLAITRPEAFKVVMSLLVPDDAADKLVLAPDAVVAPVPPCATDSAVVKPVKEVISLFAPDAAAPRFVRALEATEAPVPPLETCSVPVIPVVRDTLVIVLDRPLIVLLDSVSVVALATRVSVALGRVRVLSAVGSVAVRVVSKASSVVPSNTIAAPAPRLSALAVLMAGELIVGEVRVLFVNFCVSVVPTTEPVKPCTPEEAFTCAFGSSKSRAETPCLTDAPAEWDTPVEPS